MILGWLLATDHIFFQDFGQRNWVGCTGVGITITDPKIMHPFSCTCGGGGYIDLVFYVFIKSKRK